MTHLTRAGRAGLIAAALTLAITGAALAAHPRKGHSYRGFTAAPKVNGFRAPVRFTVSADGRKLLRFTYGTLGCQGAGGFLPGKSPYTGTFLAPVGPIAVSANGHFAIHNARHSYTSTGGIRTTTTTISSVTGRFANARTASGTIVLHQKFVQAHSHFGCGPVTLHFTVKAH